MRNPASIGFKKIFLIFQKPNLIKEQISIGNNEFERVVFGYNEKKQITFQASGEGGLSELRQNLKETEIQYALLRV